MEWSWSAPGAALTFRDAEAMLKRGPKSGFAFWCHSEKPRAKRLVFEALKQTVASYGIHRSGGTITGRPTDGGSHPDFAKEPYRFWLADGIDPDYFTADEAAYLFRRRWGGLLHRDLQQRFRDLTMRARLEPGSAHEGHVLLPRREGGRFVEITTNGSGRVRRFGFPLRTPDGHFDFERMNVAEIQKDTKPEDLSRVQLRKRLEQLPATVTNAEGSAAGDPYFTDGLRLVVFLSETPVAAEKVRNLGWDQTQQGPIEFGQGTPDR
jgi:hypothetical protein